MLVGQGLVVVDVYPNIARARVGLGARRVVGTEAAAVGAPAAPARRWRTVHRTPVARVGEYHITNAGFSDVTTVASHDSASTSITPPADSRLASKYACVVRSNITSNVQREGIRCWQPLIQMMVLTRRAAEKAYERFAETDYCSKLMRSCCAGGV